MELFLAEIFFIRDFRNFLSTYAEVTVIKWWQEHIHFPQRGFSISSWFVWCWHLTLLTHIFMFMVLIYLTYVNNLYCSEYHTKYLFTIKDPSFEYVIYKFMVLINICLLKRYQVEIQRSNKTLLDKHPYLKNVRICDYLRIYYRKWASLLCIAFKEAQNFPMHPIRI